MNSSAASTPLSRRAARAAALAAGLACLAAPSAAQADSIVYVDGGNVFSAAPDGSRKVQLTDGGAWHSPTQADDGTIAAVEGTGPIRVMAPDGRPLRSIQTQQAATGNGGTFAARPVQLSFSPDGSRIAYAYAQSSCPPASTCTGQTSSFYTAANVTEATPIEVWGNQFSTQDPEWVTNDRALVFGGAGRGVSIDDLGGGDDSNRPWVTPDTDIGDGELSRDGRRLVTVFDYGENTRLLFWSVNGDARTDGSPPQPDPACDTSRDAKYGDPTWSPDGSTVAFESKEGIELFRFSELAANHCVAEPAGVLTTTGDSPDWGPADPPAARWTPPAETGPGGPAAPAGPSGPVAPAGPGPVAPQPPAALRLTAGRATVTALRRGLRVSVVAPAAGRVAVRLTAGGRRVASGAVTARRAGKVTVRLSKLSRRQAARLRGRTLTLTVTAGGAKAAKRLKVR